MNGEERRRASEEQLLRVQRMASILASTVSGLRGGGEERPSYPSPPPPPPSQAAIQSLPTTTVRESDVIKECSICLEMMGVGEVIKWMACEHGFHCGCIETWLMRRDTCPVCRFKMCGEGRGGVQVDVVVDLEASGVDDGDDDSGDDGYEYHSVDYFD